MGKISLSNTTQQQPSQPQPKKLIPVLTKKELTYLLIYTSIIFLFGFGAGSLSNSLLYPHYKVGYVSPINQIENDLENKLKSTSKKLDKIEDDDLYKVLLESKAKKIEEIKIQLTDIKSFNEKQKTELENFCNNKKDELKKKEILYHR
jgi:hypothetical protein